jgi:hypothetical protein
LVLDPLLSRFDQQFPSLRRISTGVLLRFATIFRCIALFLVLLNFWILAQQAPNIEYPISTFDLILCGVIFSVFCFFYSISTKIFSRYLACASFILFLIQRDPLVITYLTFIRIVVHESETKNLSSFFVFVETFFHCMYTFLLLLLLLLLLIKSFSSREDH